ncbi:unnamed protein product, partial [Ranitomeya imitator]
EHSNGLEKSVKGVNGSPPGSEACKKDCDASHGLVEQDPVTGQESCNDEGKNVKLSEAKRSIEQDDTIEVAKSQTKTGAAKDLDFDLSSDSDSEADDKKSPPPSSSGSESECKRSWRKSKKPEKVSRESSVESVPGKPWTDNHNSDIRLVSESKDKLLLQNEAMEVQGEETDTLIDLGNGCTDKKEVETESQNSEQSGITVGESLDQSMEEDDDDSEDLDEDDHLIYLEEILVRVHTDYYAKYERYLKKELEDVPDIRKIVPELKSKVLENTIIAFSGLHPTNFPIERTRECYHARSLGAKISKNLALDDEESNKVTHLIAARAGTEKVRQAMNCKSLHVVNPDWLWSCLERWEKVEEQLFPLKEDYLKSQRAISPTTFPEFHSAFQTPLFHPTPIHPKTQPGPEVRQYDPVTGKLIRKASQSSSQSPYIQAPCPSLNVPVHGEHSSFRYKNLFLYVPVWEYVSIDRVVQPHEEQMFDDEELPTESTGEEQSGRRGENVSQACLKLCLYTHCVKRTWRAWIKK